MERISALSSKPFEEVVTAFVAAIGHPDMAAFGSNLAKARAYAEVEEIVSKAIGPSELMEFARFDLGAVLRKRNGSRAPQSMRFVVGNPLIMSQMVEHVPDAGSYAPVTILIDERENGVQLSYDKMESLLAPYGSSEALKVARQLDSKVEALLTAAAD